MIQKYDPEDIESLLLHKQFNELYPEEKEFVLRHIENQDEYESLRKTLFEVHNSSNDADWLEPDHSLKRDLMAEFAREKRGGFFIWLNTLFSMPTVSDIPWFRRPAFQVAMVSVLVVTGGLFWYNKQDRAANMAEVVEKKEQVESTKSKALVDSSSQISVAENQSKDSASSIYPPTPKLLAEVHATTQSSASGAVNFDTEYADVVMTNESVPQEEVKSIVFADESVAQAKDIASAAPVAQPAGKKESYREEDMADKSADELEKSEDVKQLGGVVKTTTSTVALDDEAVIFSKENKKVFALSQPLAKVDDLLDVLYTAH
jgi:hypothetical protein